MDSYILDFGWFTYIYIFFFYEVVMFYSLHRRYYPIHHCLILRVQNTYILVCCSEQGGKISHIGGRETPHCDHIVAVLLVWMKYCFVQNVKFCVSVSAIQRWVILKIILLSLNFQITRGKKQVKGALLLGLPTPSISAASHWFHCPLAQLGVYDFRFSCSRREKVINLFIRDGWEEKL